MQCSEASGGCEEISIEDVEVVDLSAEEDGSLADGYDCDNVESFGGFECDE